MAKVAQRLGVNEHEVVPAWEATQSGLPVQAAMRTGRIVMLQPPGEHARAIRGGVVRAPIDPLAERSLDEVLGLAVSPRGVGPGPAMDGVQGPTGGSETAREISGPIVGEDAAHPPGRAHGLGGAAERRAGRPGEAERAARLELGGTDASGVCR